MADDRERNQGMKEGGAHEAPGRNPQGDRSAGQKGGQERDKGGQLDPNRGGDGGAYKEGVQNEETRR